MNSLSIATHLLLSSLKWGLSITILVLFIFGEDSNKLENGNSVGKYRSQYQKNFYTGAFLPLTWDEVKKNYKEPNLSSQKPGDILTVSCSRIRPDNFSRIHNLMVLSPRSRCGFITLFQDHLNPNPKKLVHLFFIHLPALSAVPRPDPLVFLTGGPGQPNTYLYSGAESSINQFRYHQDYILIDYRGTGMSLPTLGCMGHLDGPYRSESEYFSSLKTCGDRLREQGVDPSLFNTQQIAADLHSSLKILGYSKANFHGVSYGTKVGLTLMREFPKVIRSMVLDSVFPLEANGFGEADVTIFNPLDNMIIACKESPYCQPKKLQQELIVFINRIMSLTSPASEDINDLPGINPSNNPSRSSLSFQLSHQERPYTDAFSLIDAFRVLSSRELHLSQWPSELRFLNSLNNHDLASFFLNRLNHGTPAQEFIYQYFGNHLKDGIPTIALGLLTDFRGLWLSVTCQEEWLSSNPFTKRDIYSSRFFPTELVEEITTILNLNIRKTGNKSCRSWGVNTSNNEKYHLPVKSDIPTLILNATIDPYTPLIWAKSVKKSLSRSHLYVSKVGSHDVAGTDHCALYTMMDFLESPLQFLKQQSIQSRKLKVGKSKYSNICNLYQPTLLYEME